MRLYIAPFLCASAAAFAPAAFRAKQTNTQLFDFPFNSYASNLGDVPPEGNQQPPPQGEPYYAAAEPSEAFTVYEPAQSQAAPGAPASVRETGSGPWGANKKILHDERTKVLVQGGGTLRTWSYASPAVEKVEVTMTTEGRPLDADIELWQGPDNTPTKMRVYVEAGDMRPFNTVIMTPDCPNAVAIRNIGQIEFPLTASVRSNVDDDSVLLAQEPSMIIQGGALKTYPFEPMVESVQVLLRTDGRPLNARIELLQGPNNNKQVIELYTEDGLKRPFYAVIATPGSGNVVRICNTAPVEFPLTANVEAYNIDPSAASDDVVLGGDAGW
jgi:hypothetical protein